MNCLVIERVVCQIIVNKNITGLNKIQKYFRNLVYYLEETDTQYIAFFTSSTPGTQECELEEGVICRYNNRVISK